MIKNCIICGASVSVSYQSEIVTCEKDHCIKTVEDSIGLHYEAGKDTLNYSPTWPVDASPAFLINNQVTN